MLRIRLLSARKPEWNHPSVEFNPAFSLTECDGLLVWGCMQREFLDYRGPRAWYWDEPRTNSMWSVALSQEALRQIQPHEFLHHSNPHPQYRFPCVTHYGSLSVTHQSVRKNVAIAVVSNYGGRFWWIRDAVACVRQNVPGMVRLRHGVGLRNRFILHPDVELYGSPETWNSFRRWPWSKPGPPPNYRGPYSVQWYSDQQLGLFAQYRIAVCLENASLPYYFTEKLVNAVRAGCVPIYHAHPTVRSTFLEGAFWIDPADYGFDPSATLAAAQQANADAVREQNWQWLHSDQLRATEGFTIWTRIAEYFVERITGGSQPMPAYTQATPAQSR